MGELFCSDNIFNRKGDAYDFSVTKRMGVMHSIIRPREFLSELLGENVFLFSLFLGETAYYHQLFLNFWVTLFFLASGNV